MAYEEEKLVVLRNGVLTKVFLQSQYREKFLGEEPQYKEMLFLSPGEYILYAKCGKFISDFAVFEEIPGFVRISFDGKTNELDFEYSRKGAENSVKVAVENSGLSVEVFMKTLEHLYRSGEFKNLEEKI